MFHGNNAAEACRSAASQLHKFIKSCMEPACYYFFKDKNLITVKMSQTHEREKTILCIQTQSQASTQVEITADIWWKHLDIRCKFCLKKK